MVQSEPHVIYRLMAGGWKLTTVDLKKGAPGYQVCDLLCMQLASYLEGGGGALMWMMPLHVNQKSNYDMITNIISPLKL